MTYRLTFEMLVPDDDIAHVLDETLGAAGAVINENCYAITAAMIVSAEEILPDGWQLSRRRAIDVPVATWRGVAETCECRWYGHLGAELAEQMLVNYGWDSVNSDIVVDLP